MTSHTASQQGEKFITRSRAEDRQARVSLSFSVAMQQEQRPFHIVLLQEKEALPSKLRAAIKSRGHTTQVPHSRRDVSELLPLSSNSLLMVYTGERHEDTDESVDWLLGQHALMRFPLILIGDRATAFERKLGQAFQISVTLDLPCERSEILSALSFVQRAVRERASSVSTSTPLPSSDHSHHSASATAEPSRTSTLMKEIEALDLLANPIGGRELSRVKSDEVIPGTDHLPAGQSARRAIAELSSAVGQQNTALLHRVAFAGHRLGQALRVPEEYLEPTKASAFLMKLSIPASARDQWSQNYVRSDDLRARLAASIRKSGEAISSELKLFTAADITKQAAQLIEGVDPVKEDDLSIAASAVVAGDLIERMCRANGVWNPRGAYKLFNWIRDDQLKGFHPKVLGSIIKMLVEAIGSTTVAVMVPKHIRLDPELSIRADKVKNYVASEHELTLPISALTPGMRLAQPICAFDGRTVLHPDLTLDHDLIWRIWQLSAIRPINQPLVVVHQPTVSSG